jgi:uncharacterized membrane protein
LIRGHEYRKFFFMYGGYFHLFLYMVGVLAVVILTGFIGCCCFHLCQHQPESRTTTRAPLDQVSSL